METLTLADFDQAVQSGYIEVLEHADESACERSMNEMAAIFDKAPNTNTAKSWGPTPEELNINSASYRNLEALYEAALKTTEVV